MCFVNTTERQSEIGQHKLSLHIERNNPYYFDFIYHFGVASFRTIDFCRKFIDYLSFTVCKKKKERERRSSKINHFGNGYYFGVLTSINRIGMFWVTYIYIYLYEYGSRTICKWWWNRWLLGLFKKCKCFVVFHAIRCVIDTNLICPESDTFCMRFISFQIIDFL